MSQPSSIPPTGVADTTRNAILSGVRWNSVLEFTHLFRGFRLAVNPAKLFVALAAIFIIYAAGRTFDAVWGPRVAPDEIERYQTLSADEFKQFRGQFAESRKLNLALELAASNGGDSTLTAEETAALAGDPRAAYRRIKAQYIDTFHRELANIHERAGQREREAQAAIAAGIHTPAENRVSPAEFEQNQRAQAARTLQASVLRARAASGRGVFDSFLAYEIKQFDALIDNTLTFVRVTPVHTERSGDLDATGSSSLSGGLLSKNPDRLFRSDTVAGCIANMTITGPAWLFSASGPMSERPASADTWGGWTKMVALRGAYLLSLVLYAIIFLACVAYSGAFICRLSALEFAGYERPPLKDVFVFAHKKFWTFLTAPLAPFIILLVAGLILTAAGMLGAIPWVGEIIVGALFFLFLAGGFILMLVLLGILGGYNLLYPTVAVEGSDTFDAMSRSFAYVYARPWRLLSYTVVLLIYGVITILFVGFAIYLLLALTHVFAGWGMNFFGAAHGAYSGQPKIDTLWPMPLFNRLTVPINWYAMSWSEYIGAVLLHFWVFTLISVLGAYVVSYYHSAHTILYFLLRRSVEGQSLTELYREDPANSPALASVPSEAPAAAPAPLPEVSPPAQ